MSRLVESVIIAAMPQDLAPAKRLGACMDIAVTSIEIDRFPDGETKLCVLGAAPTTILYCSLNEADPKLFPLLLAASALRDLGAVNIVLVAPYLCYMRQDRAFRRGEPVSQRVIGDLLSSWIDHIITVEPHLHRTKRLKEVFPEIKATTISAAPLLAQLLRQGNVNPEMLLVGPDEEAFEWTRAVAEVSKLPFATMSKKRYGDRDVELKFDASISVDEKRVVLVDDVVSTGETLIAAAAALKKSGAKTLEALVAHALCSEDDMAKLSAAGVSKLRSTDTIPHSTNAIQIAPLLAQALAAEIFNESPH